MSDPAVPVPGTEPARIDNRRMLREVAEAIRANNLRGGSWYNLAAWLDDVADNGRPATSEWGHAIAVALSWKDENR